MNPNPFGENREEDEYGYRGAGGPGASALGASEDISSRGGFGHSGQQDQGGIESNQLAGNPHSAHGFRHALMHAQSSQGGLAGKVRGASTPGVRHSNIPGKNARGKVHGQPPSRFSQGAATHPKSGGGKISAFIHSTGGLMG